MITGRQREMFDDPSTRHRTGDMDTSVDAAERIAPIRTLIQQRVLRWAKTQPNGFTDRQLAEAMATIYHSGDILRTSTYRTRRSELTDDGLIEDTGERRLHPPGNRWHAVWKAVDGEGV